MSFKNFSALGFFLFLSLFLALNISFGEKGWIFFIGLLPPVLWVLFKGLPEKIEGSSAILNPYFFFSGFFLFSLGLGSVNISYYRGTIGIPFVKILLTCSLFFFLGVFLASFFKALKKPQELDFEKIQIFIFFLLGISSFSAGVILWNYGYTFLNTYNRFFIKGHLIYGILLSLIPSHIYFAYCSSKRIPSSLFSLFLFFWLPLFILSTGGYRGLLIFLLLPLGLIQYVLTPHFSRTRLISVFLLCLLLVHIGFFIRRTWNPYQESAEGLYTKVQMDPRFTWLAPLHITFRDPLGIAQKLMEWVPSKIGHTKGKLFFSDFLALLPGKQMSGGGFIKYTLYKSQTAGGLTVSAVGGLYLDFGKSGLFLGFFIMGLIAGWLFERYKARHDVPSLVNLCFVYTVLIHYTQRGIPNPYYFFLFIVYNLGFLLFRKRMEAFPLEEKKEPFPKNPPQKKS